MYYSVIPSRISLAALHVYGCASIEFSVTNRFQLKLNYVYCDEESLLGAYFPNDSRDLLMEHVWNILLIWKYLFRPKELHNPLALYYKTKSCGGNRFQGVAGHKILTAMCWIYVRHGPQTTDFVEIKVKICVPHQIWSWWYHFSFLC